MEAVARPAPHLWLALRWSSAEDSPGEDLLRDRPPRVGDLLEEVPERRVVLRRRRRHPRGRRHRQGDGAHRPARQRHLGGLPPGPSRHPRVRGRDRRVREARDEPRLLPDQGLRPGVRRDAGGRGPRRQALQGGHARRHRALDRDGRGEARQHRDPRRSPAPRTTTCSRSTTCSPAPRSWRPATRSTRSSSATSRWSRWAGRTRRPGTRSARPRSRSWPSGSIEHSRRPPTRRRRSSTSTRRRTAPSSTTRRR